MHFLCSDSKVHTRTWKIFTEPPRLTTVTCALDLQLFHFFQVPCEKVTAPVLVRISVHSDVPSLDHGDHASLVHSL